MGNILLGLFILSNVFAKGFCHEYEVHYEVNDFGELAEPRFQISHGIIKRSALAGNVSSTASPPKSVKPTLNVTNPKTSFNGTTGKPSAITNNPPSAKPTAHPTYRNTSHPPTKIPRTQTPRNNATTRFQVLRTTPRPVNNTNGTDNITTFEDNHKYFKSRYYPSGERWWFNLNDGSGTPKLHVGLTKNVQYSDTIKTTFNFPYYGHEINKVTITNKGFLFLGQKVHKFNASMQYVAPLMADFGAHLHDKTSIRYIDTGDRFTVEWRNLKLQNQQAGTFSFQCSILKNGTIVFAYKDIPVAVSELKNNTFPVRVGLSDSFVLRYVSYGIFLIDGRWYTRIHYFFYYRYNQVELRREQVKNGSAFVMTPLPNCVLFKSCDSCVNSKTQFSCKWCPALKRCSDGIDRHRHSWLVARCDKNSRTTCPSKRPRKTTAKPPTPSHHPSRGKGANRRMKSRGGRSSNNRAGIAVLIVFCLLILIAIACWFAYAYTHPLSKSGMLLMRYGNPRKWCGNSGNGSSGGGKITFKSMSNESTA